MIMFYEHTKIFKLVDKSQIEKLIELQSLSF